MRAAVTQGASDAQIMAAFEEMLICHSRAECAHNVFDTLRESKRLSPFTPKSWVALFAPSFSGKTRAVRVYLRKVTDEAIASGRFPAEMDRHEIEKAQKTVIYISLPSSNVSQKSVIIMLLARLGDPLPDKGNSVQLLQRLCDLLHRLGTELIIIDEMQHLSAAMREYASRRNGDKPTTSIQYLIKTLLDNGHVSIICIGVPPGRGYMMSNDEIANRCYKELDFSPIAADSPEMLEVFASYLGMLAIKLVEYRLFPDVSDFISGVIPDCLLDVSGGILGKATMLARSACCIAGSRGARCVEYLDLEAATDQAIEDGKSKVKVNPFRVRRLEREAQAIAA